MQDSHPLLRRLQRLHQLPSSRCYWAGNSMHAFDDAIDDAIDDALDDAVDHAVHAPPPPQILPDVEIVYLVIQAFGSRRRLPCPCRSCPLAPCAEAQRTGRLLEFILAHAERRSDGSGFLQQALADRIVYHLLMDEGARNDLLAHWGGVNADEMRSLARNVDMRGVDVARFAYSYIKPTYGCLLRNEAHYGSSDAEFVRRAMSRTDALSNHKPWWWDARTLVGLYDAGVPVIGKKICARPFLSSVQQQGANAGAALERIDLELQLVRCVCADPAPDSLRASARLKLWVATAGAARHSLDAPCAWAADALLVRRVLWRGYRRHVERKYAPEGRAVRSMILRWMAEDR